MFTGPNIMEATGAYQTLSDRDIIFERFVERLSTTGRVVPSVHDGATPGTSRGGQGESAQLSPPPSSKGQFEMVSTSTHPGTVKPALVSDSEDITDVSVLSPQSLMMETGREQVETSSWMQTTSAVTSVTKSDTSNTDSNSAKSNSSHSITQGPFLKRALRRKRTVGSLYRDISQAAVNLQEKLDDTDCDRITSEMPKRQKLQDAEQEKSPQPSTKKESAACRVVSFPPDVIDEEMKQVSQAQSEQAPSTPFSTFCSTSSTCRPFTPPNGTSTPVTNLSPEDSGHYTKPYQSIKF